jgi:hypothetical protein
MIRFPVAVAVVLLLLPQSAPAEGPIVAVFDLEDRGSGLSQSVLDNLTDYLTVLLAESGYQVIPRDKIRDRLKGEQAESFKECYDQISPARSRWAGSWPPRRSWPPGS